MPALGGVEEAADLNKSHSIWWNQGLSANYKLQLMSYLVKAHRTITTSTIIKRQNTCKYHTIILFFILHHIDTYKEYVQSHISK